MEKTVLENIRRKVFTGLKTVRELYGDKVIQDILEVITMSYADLIVSQIKEKLAPNPSNCDVHVEANNGLIHNYNKIVEEECVNFLINELNYQKNELIRTKK